MANINAPGFFKQRGSSGQTPGDNATDVHVVSGVVSGQNLVLTMSNSTTVTVSLASIFTEIAGDNLTGFTFDDSTRTLTINQGSTSLSAHIPGGSGGDNPDTNTYVTSGSLSSNGSNLQLTLNDDTTVNISMQNLIDRIVTDTNTFLQSGVVSGDNLQLTLNNGTVVTVDVSNLNNSNVSLTDLVTGTPTTGDEPYFDGSVWSLRQRDSDADTVYTGGTAITIDTDTNTISVTPASLTDTQVSATANIGLAKLSQTDTLLNINGTNYHIGDSVTISGGGSNPQPSNHGLNLSMTPAEIELGSTDGSLNIVATVVAGFRLVSTSLVLQDQNGGSITSNKQSDTHYTATANTTIPGTITARLNYTAVRQSDSESITNFVEDHTNVARGYYSHFGTTQPAALSEMTNEGVFSNNDDVDLVAPAGAAPSAYIALPTRSGGYNFKSGVLNLDFTSLGVIGTYYTLYRDTTDFRSYVQGNTINIVIEEA